jgi:hypothetical protein
MLQTVATLGSMILLIGGCGVIAASLSQEWSLMIDVLARRARPAPASTALPPRGRPITIARQVRVVRISRSSVPLRAAA